MRKLTDLELCKKIAEIEKLPHHLEEGMNDKFINTSTIYGDVCEYNPLTDDALCFQLMVKYGVWTSPSGFTTTTRANNKIIQDKSPNKAICLAIIEAHKEL